VHALRNVRTLKEGLTVFLLANEFVELLDLVAKLDLK